MSETNVLCENFPRTNSNSNSTNVNPTQDSNGNIRSPTTIPDNLDASKSKLSPHDFQLHRRNSSHGLDLSKSHPSSPTDGINGLDLTKQELPSPNSFSRSSDPTPFTNGIPTPTQISYGPGRSHSAGEAVSPFRSDPIPNGYSPDNLANGDYKNTFLESYGRSIDSTSNRFPEGYSSKVFDPITSPPGMMTSCSGSPAYPTKMSDSFIAAKLAEHSQFPKPQDPYSKLLEDYCNNAKNNNNNITGPKLNDDYTDICGKMSDSPYKKIAESYVKQIESLANGYKSDVGIFKHENSLSPESFKSDPPTFGALPKPDPNLTNGGTFGSMADSVSSSSQPSGQSLPSIMNFSTNHLRGIAGVDSGLSGFLNSYGVGGDSRGDRGDNRSGSGRDNQGGNGGNGNDSNISRASPNNKLACRFCGKTFSQAGYIKVRHCCGNSF
ncbi:unnamed protein product [Candidula unifasciata]|uniref:Uncharacterized protein n=1 Tax=Candidula unifasciata TaxID=100452 RepID=A0A8S3YUQ4_9EUPU|nr:unnamed protein product [Candidula unifasciata]